MEDSITSHHGVRFIRAAAWIAAGLFLIALAARDLQLDRTLEVFADTLRNRATPYVSPFGPPSRVDASSSDVLVVGEPVYVNVRLPRWFRRAMLELRYQNPNALPLRVGVRTHPTQWAFQFPEPQPPVIDGAVTILRIPFNLQRAWQVERNVYRFVLSAPSVGIEQPIVIHGLRVTAERDPICLGKFCL
jgi:hypothetical protein